MMYKPQDIANWFINRGIEDANPLSQAEVQKLVYFAHAWYLAFKENPLIDESFEAWAYGPVIPGLYQELKHYGRQAISRSVDPVDLDPDTEAILEEGWSKYGHLGASKLIGLTHKIGDPWDSVYEGGVMGIEIPDDLIKKCYRERLSNS